MTLIHLNEEFAVLLCYIRPREPIRCYGNTGGSIGVPPVNRSDERSHQRGLVRCVNEIWVVAEDPTRHLVVMRDHWYANSHRFNINIAKRFKQRRMKENIGGPVKISHLIGGKREPSETAWHQLMTQCVE